MKQLQLKILSPEKTLFQGAVLSVTLPGSEGEFSILPDHTPLISSLHKGEICYQVNKDSLQKVEVVNGFVEIKKNTVTVCVE